MSAGNRIYSPKKKRNPFDLKRVSRCSLTSCFLAGAQDTSALQNKRCWSYSEADTNILASLSAAALLDPLTDYQTLWINTSGVLCRGRSCRHLCTGPSCGHLLVLTQKKTFTKPLRSHYDYQWGVVAEEQVQWGITTTRYCCNLKWGLAAIESHGRSIFIGPSGNTQECFYDVTNPTRFIPTSKTNKSSNQTPKTQINAPGHRRVGQKEHTSHRKMCNDQ